MPFKIRNINISVEFDRIQLAFEQTKLFKNPFPNRT